MATLEQLELASKLLTTFDGDTIKLKDFIEQFDKPAEKKSTFKIPKNAPLVIDVKNLTKTYKLGKQKVNALNGVTLQIKQGEFIALTGASGSGKSTLLHLIGGLDKPTSGEITVAGRELSKLNDRQLSMYRNKVVGFVYQFFYLQAFLNIHKNLEVPAMFSRRSHKNRGEPISKLAEAVGLSDRLKHLPKELSGGQMQRVAIARALLNEPDILLADEPTGNLDSTNSKSIIDLFEHVRESMGTTIVIVTHDQGIAARADRVYELKDGELV